MLFSSLHMQYMRERREILVLVFLMCPSLQAATMSITQNKVLVTGASGYIGFNVTSALVATGYTVYAVFRTVGAYERVKTLLDPKVRAVVADPHDPSLLSVSFHLLCGY
jgi:hypothetical protein